MQEGASESGSHPWSVGAPRLLPSAVEAQQQAPVLDAATAAAPVQGPGNSDTDTAIPAVQPAPTQQPGPGMGRTALLGLSAVEAYFGRASPRV